MSGPDRAAALRSRRDEQKQTDGTYPAPHQTTGRPADLVITSDMIAAPVRVEASGDLSPDERHQLGVCERAVENLATATWLAGKALHAICNRKLYRHTHARFDTYVEERWEISARAAYQMIEEWPLAERLSQTMGEPPTASHTRALLPVVRRFGLTPAADLYQQIRARAAGEDRRLTASLTGQIVKVVLKSTGWPAEETQFQAATRQLMTAEALPLTTSASPKRLALSAAADSQRQREESPLQKFAAGHGEITDLDGDSSESPSVGRAIGTPGDCITEEALQSLLSRVIAIEADIANTPRSDAPLEGEASKDIRLEIARRLTNAAHCIRTAGERG